MADYYEEILKLHWDPKIERQGLGTLLKKVNHVAIIVSDVNKSLAFYVQILGLQQIRRPNFDRHGAWLTMGNVELHLIKGVPSAPTGDHLIVPHISMESDNIGEVLKKLNEMKIPFSKNVSVPDSTESQPITQYFIRDPDGYYVELCNCDILTNFCLAENDTGIYYNEHIEHVPLLLVFKLAQLALRGVDDDGCVAIPPKKKWARNPDPVKLNNLLSRCKVYGDLMQGETEESIGLALRQANNHVPFATKIIRANKHGRETFVPPAFYKQGKQLVQPELYKFSIDEIQEAKSAKEINEGGEVKSAENGEIQEAKSAVEINEGGELKSAENGDIQEAKSVEETDENQISKSAKNGKIQEGKPAEETNEIQEAKSAQETGVIQGAKSVDSIETKPYDILNEINCVKGTNETYLSVVRKTFDHFDDDKDGYLTLEEILNVLSSLHIAIDDAIIKDNFRTKDPSDIRLVSFTEFVEIIQDEAINETQFDHNQQWEAFFNMLDLDGNGKITCAELAMVLREMNIALGDEDLENLFIEMDEDGNGYLTIDEIREFFLK